jgi:hypothetical protein
MKIIITEDNVLVIYLNVPFDFSLIEREYISFSIGKKEFKIPCDKLYLKRNQTFVLKNQGISIMNDDADIYNIDKKADILVCVDFVSKGAVPP